MSGGDPRFEVDSADGVPNARKAVAHRVRVTRQHRLDPMTGDLG